MLIDPYRIAATPVAYSAWNPADKDSDVTLSAGDTVASVTAAIGSVRGFGKDASSGTWQLEIVIGGVDERQLVGLANSLCDLTVPVGLDSNAWTYYGFNGVIYNNGSSGNTNSTYAQGDVVGIVLFGGLSPTMKWYLNGVEQTFGATLSSGTWYPVWGQGWDEPGERTATINTGPTFAYPVVGASAWG